MSENSAVSDATLWDQVISGNGDSFGIIFDRHRDRVFRHAVKVGADSHAAEDLTAMVFLEAWRRRTQIRMVDGSIIAWLLVTTNNTIRNHTRFQRRYRQFLQSFPEPQDTNDIADDVADADALERDTLILREAFARLKPPARDILTLCVVEEFTLRQASEVLGIPEGTVKSRLHRAKAQLGALFNDVRTDTSSTVRTLQERTTP